MLFFHIRSQHKSTLPDKKYTEVTSLNIAYVHEYKNRMQIFHTDMLHTIIVNTSNTK